ncbi:unnamed protein product [Phytophthora lilii]|uniref:Unnamed protein product n=1 Tax=Phytophthora lilii TaxID=2077276 RepID=A0A9W6XE40_9STRA|nr:unnamed protein product [Phytophthora lilii]
MMPKRLTHKLISDTIENYNITFHRSIGMTPKEAKGNVMETELSYNHETDTVLKSSQKNGHTLYKPANELKLVQSDTTAATINPGDILEAVRILNHKKMKNGKYKYLVEWTGAEPDSWEPQDNLRLINKNRSSTLEYEYWDALK